MGKSGLANSPALILDEIGCQPARAKLGASWGFEERARFLDAPFFAGAGSAASACTPPLFAAPMLSAAAEDQPHKYLLRVLDRIHMTIMLFDHLYRGALAIFARYGFRPYQTEHEN